MFETASNSNIAGLLSYFNYHFHPQKKSQFFVAVFRKSVRVNIMILAYSNSKKVEFQLLNMSWYINLYFERY